MKVVLKYFKIYRKFIDRNLRPQMLLNFKYLDPLIFTSVSV